MENLIAAGIPQYSIDWAPVTTNGNSIVLPVWSMVPNWSQVIDAVTFELAKPAAFTLETGEGRTLGADSLWAAQNATSEWPLFVHETPLAWLRDGCRGCCILHPRTIPAELMDVKLIAVREHVAPRLDKLLREFRFRRPRIVIFEEDKVAA